MKEPIIMGIYMKILFVPSNTPDFLEDIIYHGLINLFGRKKVIDYPMKASYHCDKKSVTERVEFGCRCSLLNQNFKRFPSLHFFDKKFDFDSKTEIKVDDFDLVVFGSLRPDVSNIVKNILKECIKRGVISVFLDGEDDPFVRNIYFQGVNFYFKRETLISFQNIAFKKRSPRLIFQLLKTRSIVPLGFSNIFNVMPLTFGIIDYGFKPVKEKEFDVSFIATPTSKWRLQVNTFLKKYVKKRKLKAFIGYGLNLLEYMKFLSKSKISISVRGGGFDTYRYWEIPYANSMLLSEMPDIIIPNNFKEGVSASFFKNIDELKNKLDFYIKKEEVLEMAEEGRKLLMKKHTSIARAKQMLDCIK
jgi:hypothetical protein